MRPRARRAGGASSYSHRPFRPASEPISSADRPRTVSGPWTTSWLTDPPACSSTGIRSAELGTLNHITDDVRLAAARAVRHGRSVSCAWEVAVPQDMQRSTTTCPCAADMPGAENMPVPGFRDDRRWGFSSERLGITFHGNTLTHVDSPCHIFWDGTMYNGRSHSLVDVATGSAWAAVTAA